MKLTDKLIVLLTSEEKKRIHEEADKARMRFSKYVRKILREGMENGKGSIIEPIQQ